MTRFQIVYRNVYGDRLDSSEYHTVPAVYEDSMDDTNDYIRNTLQEFLSCNKIVFAIGDTIAIEEIV